MPAPSWNPTLLPSPKRRQGRARRTSTFKREASTCSHCSEPESLKPRELCAGQQPELQLDEPGCIIAICFSLWGWSFMRDLCLQAVEACIADHRVFSPTPPSFDVRWNPQNGPFTNTCPMSTIPQASTYFYGSAEGSPTGSKRQFKPLTNAQVLFAAVKLSHRSLFACGVAWGHCRDTGWHIFACHSVGINHQEQVGG